jgi:molybdenum cofactor cytidylyltransferase
MQGILLAAGTSSRFGSNKLVQCLPNGVPLALTAARNLESALPGLLAIVNGRDRRLIEILGEAGLRVSICPVAAQGMGASLAWGVSQTVDADGWIIALADMPFIAPATIKSVVRAVDAPDRIAAPAFKGQRGHPVAFGRAYRKDLMQLAGDRGAREVLERHAEQVIAIASLDPGILHDIDIPQQVFGQLPG